MLCLSLPNSTFSFLYNKKGGIGILSFCINLSITLSINACIFKLDKPSKGVAYKLTITKSPPLLAVPSGIFAAGVTLRDEPRHNCKSALLDSLNPKVISLSGRFSPKLMIESNSSLLHFGSSHFLPV